MQQAMLDIFDPFSCPNLLSKYQQLGINQFKNDYLRELVQEARHLTREFHVFAEDIEFRNKLIVPEQ